MLVCKRGREKRFHTFYKGNCGISKFSSHTRRDDSSELQYRELQYRLLLFFPEGLERRNGFLPKIYSNKTDVDGSDKIFDAYLRMGDGYFSLKDYINSS